MIIKEKKCGEWQICAINAEGHEIGDPIAIFSTDVFERDSQLERAVFRMAAETVVTLAMFGGRTVQVVSADVAAWEMMRDAVEVAKRDVARGI